MKLFRFTTIILVLLIAGITITDITIEDVTTYDIAYINNGLKAEIESKDRYDNQKRKYNNED